MNRNFFIIFIIIALAGFLILTNPDKNGYSQWDASRLARSGERTPANIQVWEDDIRGRTTRTNYVFFSVFEKESGAGEDIEWTERAVGVLGTFFSLRPTF